MFKIFSSKKIQILTIVALTTLVYSNIFQNGFVSDDRGFILKWAPSKKISDIPKVLVGDGPPFRKEATYRPIRDTLYVLYGQVFGTSTFGWHLHGLLVHLAVTVLVYLIVDSLIRDHWLKTEGRIRDNSRMEANVKRIKANEQMGHLLPFIAALLFGLHPIHTEAITFMTSSMDMIGPLFMFGSFYGWVKGRGSRESRGSWWKWKVGSVGLAGLAFFSYEMTLILPILILLYEWTIGKNFQFPISNFQLFKKRILVYLPYFAAALIYVFIRVFLVGRYPGQANYWIDATSFNWSRFMEPEVILKYLKILFFPINLSFNHVIRPGFDTFLAWVNDPAIFDNYQLWPIFLALIVIAAILVLAFKIRQSLPLLSFGILWFFVALLPFVNILPQPALMAERYLFVASFGFILAILALLDLAPKLTRRVVIATLLLFWGTLTYLRNSDWQNGIKIWEAAARVYPQSALAYNNIGKEHVDREEYEKAIPFYQKTIELRPRYFYALNDLATSWRKVGKLDLSEKEYKRTLSVNPNYIQSYLGLAQVYRDAKRYDLAHSTLLSALKIKIEDTPLSDESFSNLQASIYNDMGLVLEKQDKVKEALEAYARAIELDSQKVVAFNNWRGLIIKNPSIWKEVGGDLGSFAYPPIWELVEKGEEYILISDDRRFRIVIEFGEVAESLSSYLEKQTETFGELVSEEFTKLSGFDSTYVKIWQDGEIHKIQFFLFRGMRVVKILAYPSESSLKAIVDGIISTIHVDNTN
ncbi:tetratricopeptide repeat protein [Candidatus Curtissbacteria bacterium]|nr:tetratricopeptide repeat protein [Candidatus Curtissbacteria bacterium]